MSLSRAKIEKFLRRERAENETGSVLRDETSLSSGWKNADDLKCQFPVMFYFVLLALAEIRPRPTTRTASEGPRRQGDTPSLHNKIPP